ncbi:hypothetical protein [Promicromonospora sp. NPDC023805]|uniref:hypothetical protein n=1 Tax=Promicromonospora sp. NPDC023805 TaxID=3154696 RepID=UPI0033FA80ED
MNPSERVQVQGQDFGASRASLDEVQDGHDLVRLGQRRPAKHTCGGCVSDGQDMISEADGEHAVGQRGIGPREDANGGFSDSTVAVHAREGCAKVAGRAECSALPKAVRSQRVAVPPEPRRTVDPKQLTRRREQQPVLDLRKRTRCT